MNIKRSIFLVTMIAAPACLSALSFPTWAKPPANPGHSSAKHNAAKKHAVKSNRGVTALQEALNKNGVHLEVTGHMTQATWDAVKEFQQKNGLGFSGKLDSKTLEKLGLNK